MSPATKISTRLLLFRRLLRLLFVMVLVFLPSWFCYKLWNSPYMRIWNVEIEGSAHGSATRPSGARVGTLLTCVQAPTLEVCVVI